MLFPISPGRPYSLTRTSAQLLCIVNFDKEYQLGPASFGHFGKLMQEKMNRSVAPHTALTGAGKGNAQTRPARARARSAPSPPERMVLGNTYQSA